MKTTTNIKKEKNKQKSQNQQQNESKHCKMNSNNYVSLGSQLEVFLHVP